MTPLQSDVIVLQGGLDEANALTMPTPGRLIGGENIEAIFGQPGYWTAAGYERMDGRALASSASFTRLTMATAPGFLANTDATTPGGSCRILAVSDDGLQLVVTAVAGTVELDQLLTAGAKSAVISDVELGGLADEDWASSIRLARNYYRSLIQPVPGAGPVRGVVVFKGAAYALRDAVGLATAALWRSSPAGWVLVRSGLRPGGQLRAQVDNFGGSSAMLALYAVDGKNRYWCYDGATFTFGPAVYGTEGSSASNVVPGLGNKAFTIAEAGKAWAVGREVLVYSSSNAANYCRGLVVSYAANVLTVNVTAFGGVAAVDWHVCAFDGTDRPYLLAIHSKHLFLAYPLGQLQTSDVAAPMSFTASASLFGCGDEIRSLCALRGAVLAVALGKRIELIYGTDKLTWEMRPHSATAGTRTASMLEAGGNAVFMSDAGVMTLQGSQNFGDFEGSTLSKSAKRTLARLMTDYRAVSLSKSTSQFRVYGRGGEVLVMTATSEGGNFLVGRVCFTPLRYKHQASCTAFETINGEEVLLFGTDDGYVMRERSGTTYDGAPIEAWLRTSFWHSKSPLQRKRYQKLIMDAVGIEPALISARQDFDLGAETYPSGVTFKGEVHPAGGLLDMEDWNTFYWSEAEASQIEAYAEGVGKNMAVMLWIDHEGEPVNFVAITVLYKLLGIQR